MLDSTEGMDIGYGYWLYRCQVNKKKSLYFVRSKK